MRVSLLALLLGLNVAAHAGTISIMSYNVENLFDTDHDQGKDDYEFLPNSNPEKIQYCKKNPSKFCMEKNWTADKLEVKLDQIAKVVELVGERPQFLAVVEVENANVVRKLADKLKYPQSIVTDSPDKRGVDVGLMFDLGSDLNLLGTESHNVPVINPDKPTRDILEVRFEVKSTKKKLSVFVNHWPSQGQGVEARLLAAKKLSEIVALRTSEGVSTISMGDFNVSESTDRPLPFDLLLDKKTGTVDVHAEQAKNAGTLGLDLSKASPGSYFYISESEMRWNRLDRFFASESMFSGNSGFKLDLSSYKIVTDATISKRKKITGGKFDGQVIQNTPIRYNFNATNPYDAGFSDHFPIFVKLNY